MALLITHPAMLSVDGVLWSLQKCLLPAQYTSEQCLFVIHPGVFEGVLLEFRAGGSVCATLPGHGALRRLPFLVEAQAGAPGPAGGLGGKKKKSGMAC